MSSAFYFVIVIGILVFIHEFGHFIAARISKMRVDIFALGMGPRLFGWNKKKGFTFGKLPEDFDGEGKCDYRVCAFPIGGYVKIAGMIDESMDTDYVQKAPQPWEFRSKNAFFKAFTISAGVIMNVFLAWFVFSYIQLSEGSYHNPTTTIGSVTQGTVATKIGLKANDKVIKINNKPVHTWQEFIQQLAIKDFGGSRVITVLRDNQEVILKSNGDDIVRAIGSAKGLGFSPNNAFVLISGVETLKPAGKAGIKEGDTVIRINTATIASVSQFQETIKANKSQQMEVSVKRGADTLNLAVTPDASGLIGVGISEGLYGNLLHKSYSIGESMALGWEECVSTVKMFFNTFSQIFKGNISAKQSLGGPLMIAQAASKQADMGLANFLHFLGMLSMSLAIINILPVPALDGGHLLFIIIEAIIRREVPIKIKMAFQQAGLWLIVLLTVFVFYNDIARIFGL